MSALYALPAMFMAQGAAARSMPEPLTAQESCAPSQGLSYVCGLDRAEDIIPVPGTRWIVAGAFGGGGGLALVDGEAKQAWQLYSAVTPSAPDRKTFPGCATPPDPATFKTLGLSLRQVGAKRFMLYAVSQLPRLTVEAFELGTGADRPVLTWKGCVPLPGTYVGNSVTSFADGTILVTVLQGLDGMMADAAIEGKNTGAVFQAAPGAPVFTMLEGTRLPTPNGIETSPDGKEFYVVSGFRQSFFVFDRSAPSGPVRETRAPFNPDNLRWSAGRLIAAGSRYDEPACGGVRRFVRGVLFNASCHRGFEAQEIDPVSLRWTALAYGPSNPAFGGVATAIVVGDTLWLSSVFDRRIAYRPLGIAP